MSKQAQNVKPVQDANTPPNVIANTARFNTQFNNIQIGNPITVNIGKLLTVRESKIILSGYYQRP